MDIKTKFNLNDFVIPIRQGFYYDFIPCGTCRKTGMVKINNTDMEMACPICYGRKGEEIHKQDEWTVDTYKTGFVGLIKAEITDSSKITYMLDSTGIGSGTLWQEADLFMNREDAFAECDKRNKKNEK